MAHGLCPGSLPSHAPPSRNLPPPLLRLSRALLSPVPAPNAGRAISAQCSWQGPAVRPPDCCPLPRLPRAISTAGHRAPQLVRLGRRLAVRSPLARFPLSPRQPAPLAPASLHSLPLSLGSGSCPSLLPGGSVLSTPLGPPTVRPWCPLPVPIRWVPPARGPRRSPRVRPSRPLPPCSPFPWLRPQPPGPDAFAHPRSARAAAATAAATGAGASAGRAGGAETRRAAQPWGSRSARLGDARLPGLSRLTASRGAGAGARAGAPAGAEPGRWGTGAACLLRSAGGAGGAPLAPSCTHPGDLSASPGVRAAHSHRSRPPRPPPQPAAPLLSPLRSRSPPPAPSPRRPGLGNKRAGKRFKRPDIPGCAADAPPAL